ncbi:MAG: transcriptional repressor [Candidatus Omnitrophica bacterium]|nr:transcriptional repressor [Candidatus Omnitrophota bacterium]MBD3269404.1 transcriptional repressor [Candidatus Omnitrophota bacterium]
MYRGPRRGHAWWQGRFRGCGYRLTLPRQAVLDVLSRTSKHLSAEEIYLEVRKINPGSGLSTVYRTLELLVQMGLVFKFDFGDGRARYELIRNTRDKNHHHHHLICINCNRVIDYSEFIREEEELLSKTEKELSNKYDFKIKKHIVQFYGLCGECRKELED